MNLLNCNRTKSKLELTIFYDTTSSWPALPWPGLVWLGRGPWLANQPEVYLASSPSFSPSRLLCCWILFIYLAKNRIHSRYVWSQASGYCCGPKVIPEQNPLGQRDRATVVAPLAVAVQVVVTRKLPVATGNHSKSRCKLLLAVAGWGCLLVVLARIEARWMLSWEFAAQFDVTSNLQLAACNGQLGAAPKLTLPPSKSARSWEYLHWAALRKTVAIKLTYLINELNFICSVPPKSSAPSVRFPCFSCVWPGTRQAPNWQSIPRHEFLFMRNLMMMRWMYPFICRYRCMVSVSISIRSCVPQSVAVSVVRMQTMPQLQSPCSSCNNNNNKGICNWNEKPALALVAASTAHTQLHSCNLQFYVGATLRQEPTISLTPPHISSLPLSLSVWCNKWKC